MLSACVLLWLMIPEASSSSDTDSVWFTARFVALRTLDTMKHPKAFEFGHPRPPHHGYVLLIWYVQQCMDNNNKSLCNITAGEYGFHNFNNTGPLLPKVDRLDKSNRCDYYTVGNLKSYHYKYASDLPYEVRRYYNRYNSFSNMDRLLVKYCLNQNLIMDIYASELYHFDYTYQIGPSLISDLRLQTHLEYDGLAHLSRFGVSSMFPSAYSYCSMFPDF